MNRGFVQLLLIALLLVAFPFRSPAPLVYRQGLGWTYEPVGGSVKWQKIRAKDQLDVAQAAFNQREYGLALKAALRVVKVWPLSDYGAQAQLKNGTAREKQHNYALAVKAYERAADRYHDRPKVAAEALYRAGLAYKKQAQTAEYDQSAAGQAIATLGDFKNLYADEPRV